MVTRAYFSVPVGGLKVNERSVMGRQPGS